MDKIVIKGIVYHIYSMEIVDKDLILYLKHEDSHKEYGESYSDDGGYYYPYTETITKTKAVLKIPYGSLFIAEPETRVVTGED